MATTLSSNTTCRKRPYDLEFIVDSPAANDVILIEDSPQTHSEFAHSKPYPNRVVTRSLASAMSGPREEQITVPSACSAVQEPPPPKRKRKAPTTKKNTNTKTRKTNATKASKTQLKLIQSNETDDKDGHYIIRPSDVLAERYQIVRILGQGTFGKVVECWDSIKKTYCAVKIIRSIQKYREAAKIELRVLTVIKQRDPLNLHKCIHLVDSFDYKNHICMVFDLLSQSLFDFLKDNSFEPFPLHHIQNFSRQLLSAVSFIHGLKLIHTDLKPENILLTDNNSELRKSKKNTKKSYRVLKNPEIRLIDFGSATFEEEYHSSVVSTRHYRAPEVILNLGWSYPCDIWSIGCILVELFTGEALFQTHDNLEHLAMMEGVLGKIPAFMINRSPERFFTNGQLSYPNDKTTRSSKKYVNAMKTLSTILKPEKDLAHQQFFDLVSRLLTFDPSKRITARQALSHPFLKLESDEDGNFLSIPSFSSFDFQDFNINRPYPVSTSTRHSIVSPPCQASFFPSNMQNIHSTHFHFGQNYHDFVRRTSINSNILPPFMTLTPTTSSNSDSEQTSSFDDIFRHKIQDQTFSALGLTSLSRKPPL